MSKITKKLNVDLSDEELERLAIEEAANTEIEEELEMEEEEDDDEVGYYDEY